MLTVNVGATSLLKLHFRAIPNVSTALKTSVALQATPTRSIILLAVAGFASQAQVRVMDSLLPQVAADLHTTVGVAAMVVTAYAVTHGSIQLVIGPVGDYFGKYRTVAVMCGIGAVLVALLRVPRPSELQVDEITELGPTSTVEVE